jgi:BirA family biotin operon repressor/biotin-[acetyl-CoA-carboxylase] ligase
MKLASTLLPILADGHFHSGTELGSITGRSRSAIWKAIKSMQALGIEIYSVRGKGYRLSEQFEPLDRGTILANLDQDIQNAVVNLESFVTLDSTNSRLLEIARQGGTGHVCLAEQQLSGRGRRGRSWISPFGGNLYFSVLWRFAAGASQMTGLSLAVAVAICRALRQTGLKNVGVKWPNDIVVSGQKLAGILLEIVGEAAGPCAVVVGIGLNVRMPAERMAEVNQSWVDLETVLGVTVARNVLAASLISHVIHACQDFDRLGLAPFLDEWQSLDAYVGQQVIIHLPNDQLQGVVKGVDHTGALLLEQGNEIRRFLSGEISLRAVPGELGI